LEVLKAGHAIFFILFQNWCGFSRSFAFPYKLHN
jgi:hypothetical protein